MPKRFSRNSTSRRGRRSQSAVVTELKQTNELLTHQITSMVPLTKDIMFPRIKRNKVYTYYDSVSIFLQGNTSAEVDGVIDLAYTSFASSTQMLSAFDSYRIVAMKADFIPSNPAGGAELFTAIDYDDFSATTIANLLRYDSLAVNQQTGLLTRVWSPKIQMAASSGALTQGSPWVDSTTPSPRYCGLKYGINSSTTPGQWTVVVTACIQLRNPA